DPVTIQGLNFTGTTGVSFFNEVKANSYQVVSDTEITAHVPKGAETGPIAVSNTIDTTSSGERFTVESAASKTDLVLPCRCAFSLRCERERGKTGAVSIPFLFDECAYELMILTSRRKSSSRRSESI